MTLEQVSLNLAHGVENNTHGNEHTGAAEEERNCERNVEEQVDELWEKSDQGKRGCPKKVRRVITKSRNFAVGSPGRTPGT